MPIRLNLLAEAKALEEFRRKDPVKRAAFIGMLVLALLLVWSSSLQVRCLVAKGDVGRLDSILVAQSNSYNAALVNKWRLADSRQKLLALHQLATNRFLYGPVLNALQQTIVDDVQLTRLKTDQSYAYTEAVKAGTNANNKPVPAKPAFVTEKVVIMLEAKDTGDARPKYQESIATSDYFRELLGKTNEVRLAQLSPPNVVAGNKPYVAFTLECRLPERVR